MQVFVEYNEPIGPISGFGLGDGTPGGLIIEKRVFLIFFLVRCIQGHEIGAAETLSQVENLSAADFRGFFFA